MIAGTLARQQLLAAHLAFGVELAGLLLFLVGDTAGHRARRHEDRREMAEAQRTDDEAGDDLVANAEQQRAFEHAVTERNRGAHRDHIAAE